MRCFLLVGASLAGAAAQSPPPIAAGIEKQLLAEITSRLASAQLETVAWGAHLAAEHRVAAAAPQLQQALARLATRQVADDEHTLVALALLDALVQTAVRVKADDVMPFLDAHTRPAIVLLLARSPKVHTAFFRAELERHDGDSGGPLSAWCAAGNLLATQRDSFLATRVLDSLHYELRVVVHDPGTKAGGGSSMSGTGADRNRPLVVPAGFPPTVLYELTMRGTTDDVLVAPGPTPVFARRFVRRETNAATEHEEPAPQGRQQTRLQWLAQMARCDVADFGSFARTATWVWRDEATLRADAARVRQEIDAAFRTVEQRCREADLDDRDDAAVRPLRLTIRVQDSRRDQTTPLPSLD